MRPEEYKRLFRGTGLSRHLLARDGEVSYDSIRSWTVGRTRPKRENLIRLAAGLSRRAEILLAAANRLNRVAQERDD